MIHSFKQLRSLQSKAANLGLGLEKDVSGQFLEGLNLLENIDFSGNMFSSLHVNLFRSQYHSLVTLSLSDNKLTDFPINISKYSKLVYIDVSKNRIRYLQTEMIKEK
jgi:Leucine-rich repeat (LRR) protein